MRVLKELATNHEGLKGTGNELEGLEDVGDKPGEPKEFGDDT